MDDSLELRAAGIHQVEAHVCAANGRPRAVRNSRGLQAKIEDRLGDFHFAKSAVPGEFGDHPAIAVTAFEIHLRIGGGGVAREQGMGTAHRLENIPPGRLADPSQAGQQSGPLAGRGLRQAIHQLQLQGRPHCPDFANFKLSRLLVSLEKRDEIRFAEAIAAGLQVAAR